MKLKIFIGFLFTSLLCFVYKAYAQSKEIVPNIIFIFADDLGWGDLSCYGSDGVKTPYLDKMASEGRMFTQFYVAGSVCSPSRVGIMTGQYPARNRIFGHFSTKEMNMARGMPDDLDPNLFTLTDMLKQRGYVTGHFGKWHLGSNISCANYGIDVFRTDLFSNVKGGEKIDIWSPKARPTCTKDILNEAMDFIENNANKPFYTNVWLTDVHATLNPSKEQLEPLSRYKPGSYAKVPFYGIRQVYYAALLEMDKQIGLFLDKLDSMGLSENTLVIFSSDNGPEDYYIRNAEHSGAGSTGPFRGRKRSIYEGGIRVPFILRWPGHIPENTVNDKSVIDGVDFLPTISSLINGKIPSDVILDGENMADVWLGSNRRRKKTLYWEWRYDIPGSVLNKSPMIAVREGDYKLLMNPDSSRIELYNVIEDPSELHNLTEQKPEIEQHLIQEAMDWYQTIPNSPAEKDAGKNDWNWPSQYD